MENNIYNKKIFRYPFNGRSKYLIDKFYIMGFDSKTLYRNLIENINDDSINKSNSSLNLSIEDLFSKNESKKIPQVFHIDDPPTVINEITSDYKKQVPDKDLIKDMIFPNKIDFYCSEEIYKMKSFFSAENNIKINNNYISKLSSNSNNNNNDINKDGFNSIFIKDDNYKSNYKYIKPYNVIFSYNPQTGTNSKKSINGFAHIFYRKYYKNKNIGDKAISFYVPIIFCIISEFPFYNSFYILCNQIKNLYEEKNIEVPLEIFIYNIINFTLSPINNDIFLFIEPISFPTKKIEIKNFQENKIKNNFIEEVDEENSLFYIDNNENKIFEEEIIEEIDEDKITTNSNNKGDELSKKINKIKIDKNKNLNTNNTNNSGLYRTRNRLNTNYKNFRKNKLNLASNNNRSNDNIFGDIYENKNDENDVNNISSEIILNKSTDVKNLRKSLSDKNLKINNISSDDKKNKIKTKIKSIYTNKFRSYSRMENFKSELKHKNNSSIWNMHSKLYDNIKFNFLPGYPII